MKIKRFFCAIALTYIATLSATAQVEKEVEVTQAFVPVLKSSTKPMLLPDMSDDAYISPDIDYSITPRSIHTEIDVAQYEAIEMDYWEYVRQSNYYAKVGVGLPLRSEVDLYASKFNSGESYIIGFLNQSGDYAKIENDFGVKSDATRSKLRLGSAAGLMLGRKRLDGSLTYDNDLYTRYATSNSSDYQPLYQNTTLKGRYGDTFTDWDRTNFAIRGEAGYMWRDTDINNTTVGVGVDIGSNLFGGKTTFSLGFNSISGYDGYLNTSYCGGFNYQVEGNNALVVLGAKYCYDGVKSDGETPTNSHYIIPRIKLDYKLDGQRLVAYMDLDGEIKHNSFAELSRINPYITPSRIDAEYSSVCYSFDVGFKGIAWSNMLFYDISVGYEFNMNDRYWAFIDIDDSTGEGYNGYALQLATRQKMGVKAEAEYRASSKLNFKFEGALRQYTTDEDEWESGLSALKMRLEGEYKVGKFEFGLNGEFLSKRRFSELSYTTYNVETSVIEIPATFNLGASVQYRTKRGSVLFCELSNLLGAELYEWARYREYGVGALVGIRVEF